MMKMGGAMERRAAAEEEEDDDMAVMGTRGVVVFSTHAARYMVVSVLYKPLFRPQILYCPAPGHATTFDKASCQLSNEYA